MRLRQTERRFVVTTDSAHALRTYSNLLADLTLGGPAQAWVADVTSIRLPTTIAYLPCILDAWSRRGVGWHPSRAMDTPLTLAALDQALATRQPPGLIQHSDRGVQYANVTYYGWLRDASAQISMAAGGNPYENAIKTLRREVVSLQYYQTFQEAETNLGRFIADVSNAKRLHSRLGCLPPIEFEAVHAVVARS